jgi:hypothetical protein
VLADEQAAFLREAYDGIENFRDAVGFLFSGFFRGYAHLEKHFDPAGLVTRLEPVEQWFWVRDGMFGDWEYNEDAVSGRRRGVPIDPECFVWFETVPFMLQRGFRCRHSAGRFGRGCACAAPSPACSD